MRRVLKWPVPVDDGWHPIGGGQVALVEVQNRPDGAPEVHRPVGVVTVWTVESVNDARDPVSLRAARVFGTGHPVPDDTDLLGSCQDGALVWHLFGSDQRA